MFNGDENGLSLFVMVMGKLVEVSKPLALSLTLALSFDT